MGINRVDRPDWYLIDYLLKLYHTLTKARAYVPSYGILMNMEVKEWKSCNPQR